MSGPEPRGTEGLAERRAALQLLDGVLRRGVTLESAAQRTAAEHRPLALAIAGETLRRLPELDAMIGYLATRAEDPTIRAVRTAVSEVWGDQSAKIGAMPQLSATLVRPGHNLARNQTRSRSRSVRRSLS